ncbi:hypothetical protein SUGI_1055880 [Cryptomeria japonica]|nr:hypothetical protein SUGI_1055880 [Cryptomeria japonica]
MRQNPYKSGRSLVSTFKSCTHFLSAAVVGLTFLGKICRSATFHGKRKERLMVSYRAICMALCAICAGLLGKDR